MGYRRKGINSGQPARPSSPRPSKLPSFIEFVKLLRPFMREKGEPVTQANLALTLVKNGSTMTSIVPALSPFPGVDVLADHAREVLQQWDGVIDLRNEEFTKFFLSRLGVFGGIPLDELTDLGGFGNG